MNDENPVVSLKDVTKTIDDCVAVDTVAFELTRGTFLTILGPSGSGKSALLRLIAGLDEVSAGEIMIDGRDVTNDPAHARSVGMVFPNLALFPHMSVAENVAFPLRCKRFDRKSITERIDAFLNVVRLDGFGAMRIQDLSELQQQHVALARALAFEPAVLLLNAPTAALDQKTREDMHMEFRRVSRELGVATINVTDDHREAFAVSDEIAVMDGGCVLQTARPEEIYRHPVNSVVAGLTGEANFLSGKIVEKSKTGVGVLVGETRAYGLPMGRMPTLGEHGESMIRAEHICIAPMGDPLPVVDNVLIGTLREAIFEGARMIYVVHVPALGQSLKKIGRASCRERVYC